MWELRHVFPLHCLFHVPGTARYSSPQLQWEIRLISCPLSWVWCLIPRKPMPELIRHKLLSKWLLVEQHLSWAPLGLLLCCECLLLSSGGPELCLMLGQCCPLLVRDDGRNTGPGQVQCLSLLLWTWSCFVTALLRMSVFSVLLFPANAVQELG